MLKLSPHIDSVRAVRGDVAFAPVTGPGLLYAANSLGTYWEVDDLTCLAQDNAGTIPVTANDQTIGRINDKRFLYPMVQPSAVSRPLLKGGGAARFLQHDDSNDFLETGLVSSFKFLHDGTGCTIWVIGQDDGAETKYYFGTKVNTAAAAGLVFQRNSANNRPSVNVTNGTIAISAALGAAVPSNSWPVNTLKMAAYTYLSPTMKIYVNGVEVASAAEGASPSSGNHPVPLRTTGATSAAPGDIRAFGVDNRVYSAAELLGIYQHYQGKGTLP